MTTKRILVGGVGNIFLGDDAFGVETVRQLMKLNLPQNISVVDFGIRSYDLLYAVTGGYDAVILVDAVQRDQAPGTLYLIEPESNGNTDEPSSLMNAHALTLAVVLDMMRNSGASLENLYLVGCEPLTLESDDTVLTLSDEVRAAVPHAITMILNLLDKLTLTSNHIFQNALTGQP